MLAYIFAPLTTSPVLTGLTYLYAAQWMPQRELLDGIGYPFFFFSFFGLPLAYLTELLLVAVVKACGQRPAEMKRRVVVVLGAIAGALVFGLFGLPSWSESLIMGAAGALMGAVASATFALIRGPALSPSWAS